MILTFYIDVEYNISIRSLVGNMGKAEFISIMEVIWMHPDYSIKQNHLVDMRQCKVTLSPHELGEMTDLMTSNENVRDRKVALLVGASNPAGHSAMYSEKTKSKHLSEVFASEKKAMIYTHAPSDIFEKLNSELATVVEI